MVIGPGAGAIEDLQKILDIAWENQVGVMPCLWSFDMLRISNGTNITDRSMSMLSDTTYLRAYINNSLIPMVEALKGHPAIIAWEIFNEPEGMSNEHGWNFNRHVPMSYFQRFINRCAGAIHRTDPGAQVTNDSWSFIAQTDVGGNYNYYTDQRLLTVGGDADGYLDFYTVHYYDWAGTALSPFHHPASYWNLDKPIAVCEFAVQETIGVPANNLYNVLFQNGYAGAMAWSFTDRHLSSEADMLASMSDIKTKYPQAVTIVLQAGSIIYFKAVPSIIEKRQFSRLSWSTVPGSNVKLDGIAVNESDSLAVSPQQTTTYKLFTSGAVTISREVTVEVLLPGTIIFFKAELEKIAPGETSKLSWHTVAGSSVTLNGIPVAANDTIDVRPAGDSTFTLIGSGDVSDTSTVNVTVGNPLDINRALNRPVFSSSNEPNNPGVDEPANAIDGNPSTRWSSAHADNQCINVDLGQSYDIKRVVLNWEVAYGRVYRIEVSDDAVNWEQIYFTSSGDGGINDITNLSGSDRYVRMYGIARGTQWGFSLWEFEVYGSPVASSIGGKQQQIPVNFELEQNYPNPFNSETQIKYSIPAEHNVKLEVFDLNGSKVATLVDIIQSPGNYSVILKCELDLNELKKHEGKALLKLQGKLCSTYQKFSC